MRGKPYSRLKELGWAKGQCNTIIKETGYCCQRPATYEVRDLQGKVVGKSCPECGREFERLLLGTNAFIGAKYVSKN